MRAFSTIESPLLRIACPDSPKGPLAVTAKAEAAVQVFKPHLTIALYKRAKTRTAPHRLLTLRPGRARDTLLRPMFLEMERAMWYTIARFILRD